MRFLSSLLIGATLFLASITTHAANLSLLPSVSSLQTGSSFNLDLVISELRSHTTPSLGAFDIDLLYDDNLLSLTAISFGTGLGDESLNEAFSATNTTSTGSINLSALSYLESNSTSCTFCLVPYLEYLQGDSLTLATLTFKSIQTGTAAFGITINSIGDGNGDSLATTLTTPSTIQVTAVPLPAAIWLFASSLSLLGFFQRATNLRRDTE